MTRRRHSISGTSENGSDRMNLQHRVYRSRSTLSVVPTRMMESNVVFIDKVRNTAILLHTCCEMPTGH